MIRVLVFFDGSFLAAIVAQLRDEAGGEHKTDVRKIVRVAVEQIARQLGIDVTAFDVGGIHYFGAMPVNFDPKDRAVIANGVEDFHRLLRGFYFTTHIYPVQYHGRRIRARDRSESDPFVPIERHVQVALAAKLVEFACKDVFDIAICVLGSWDFIPALQTVRELGKRVGIVSAKHLGAFAYVDFPDQYGCRDFDTTLLDDFAEKIRLEETLYQSDCASEFHVGDRRFQTPFRPRPGQANFCEKCRERKREEDGRELSKRVTEIFDDIDFVRIPVGKELGAVKRIDARYGFVMNHRGHEFYFNPATIDEGTGWKDITEGAMVLFMVQSAPNAEGKKGRARKVELLTDERLNAMKRTRVQGGIEIDE